MNKRIKKKRFKRALVTMASVLSISIPTSKRRWFKIKTKLDPVQYSAPDLVKEECGECKGTGFGTLSDGQCATCYDEYVEEHYGRRL